MTQEMRVGINVVALTSGSACMSREEVGRESKILGGWTQTSRKGHVGSFGESQEKVGAAIAGIATSGRCSSAPGTPIKIFSEINIILTLKHPRGAKRSPSAGGEERGFQP